DPTATDPGDGTVTVTGFYNCGPAIPTPTKLVVTASQGTTGNVVSAGSALVDITTCNGTDQPWSVNITGSLTGDNFIDPPRITIAEPPDNTLIGIVGVMSGTTIATFD